jgi:hypothetical protein
MKRFLIALAVCGLFAVPAQADQPIRKAVKRVAQAPVKVLKRIVTPEPEVK